MTLEHVDPKKHYFLACSFGPDSMALFHLLQKDGVSFSVLHVNYHRRGEASNYEERSLKTYCEQHGIECFVYDTTGLEVVGNFQAWARKIRYRFFKTVLDAHPDSAGVLVAHHQDDVIETFLMQKQSKRLSLHYGIEAMTVIEGVKVIRPLLDYRKGDLLKIVETNYVPYAIDASNLQNDYTRNQVRHMVVEHLSDQKRIELLEEMNDRNDHYQALIRNFAKRKEPFNQASIDLFLCLNENDFALMMTYFLNQNGMHKAISLAKMNEMKRMMERSNVPNAVLYEDQKTQLIRSYDTLYVVTQSEQKDYLYQLDKPTLIELEFLRFDGHNPRNLKRVPLEAYPITIRPAQPNDQVKIARYLKKVNRLYIDWKMPMALRKKWPVFVNKEGKIIFVPRYRHNYVQTGDNSLLLRL